MGFKCCTCTNMKRRRYTGRRMLSGCFMSTISSDTPKTHQQISTIKWEPTKLFERKSIKTEWKRKSCASYFWRNMYPSTCRLFCRQNVWLNWRQPTSFHSACIHDSQFKFKIPRNYSLSSSINNISRKSSSTFFCQN